jgi:hypothetical protein
VWEDLLRQLRGGLVTTQRDSGRKQDARKPRRPKLKKETLKDLEAKEGENVKAGGLCLPGTRNSSL